MGQKNRWRTDVFGALTLTLSREGAGEGTEQTP